MTITLPEATAAIYLKASEELKKHYRNAPAPEALILFSLERRDAKSIIDEVEGWNELSRYLKPHRVKIKKN